MDTLVLSDQYVPMYRVGWQEAITLIVGDRATVVEAYEDRFIHSAKQVWPMPSVIRFIHKVAGMFRRGVKFNRRNVWMRDKGTCAYCGHKVKMSEFTFDHVTPRHLGGTTRWENIVVSCLACNQKKSNRTPEQAGMRLRVKPIKPKSLPGSISPTLKWTEQMPRSWRDYLGSIEYWHGGMTEEATK